MTKQDHHDNVRYEMPTDEELSSITRTESQKLQDQQDEAVRTNAAAAIGKLQITLNAFPWEELGKPKPNLKVSSKLDPPTQSAIAILKQVGIDLQDPYINKMIAYIEKEDFFNAQSAAYVAKSQLTQALHQWKKYPTMPPEIAAKYPSLRRWNQEEMLRYLKQSHYPGYFPKPWDLSRFGERNWDGSFGCDPAKKTCMLSYYKGFRSWGPNKIGAGLMYDPRLFRNMDKYPNIWSHRAISFRIQKNIPSPHIPSPGTGQWMDINNLPKGKQFLDLQDKAEYDRLLMLYKKFVAEETARKTTYIAPPNASPNVAAAASVLADKYYIK